MGDNASALNGHETILLVEDEPQVLAIARQGLAIFGYTVITAANGREALKLISSPEQLHIDLLLTDVIMPDMNGRELDQAIREYLPELKTIFMSGYDADVIARRGIIQSRVNFICKPFFIDTLVRMIRKTLDRTAPPS